MSGPSRDHLILGAVAETLTGERVGPTEGRAFEDQMQQDLSAMHESYQRRARLLPQVLLGL